MIPIVGGNADELEMGEIDLTLGPARYLVPGHSSERLYEDEFVCLDWSGNRQLDRDLSLDTYLRLGHVAVRFGKHRELPTFDEWFTQHLTHDRRIEVVTTAFNLVPQLLIGTSRIATVHRRLAAFYQRFLPLRIVAPPLKIPKFEQFMQWHRSRDRDPGSIWLRSVLKSAIAESTLNKEAAPLTSARHDEHTSNGTALGRVLRVEICARGFGRVRRISLLPEDFRRCYLGTRTRALSSRGSGAGNYHANASAQCSGGVIGLKPFPPARAETTTRTLSERCGARNQSAQSIARV